MPPAKVLEVFFLVVLDRSPGRRIIEPMLRRISRRCALLGVSGVLAASQLSCSNLFFVGKRGRPALVRGVASGDVTAQSAMIWSATDLPARMQVEWSVDASFRNAVRVVGPDAVSRNGFTAKLDLTGLPPGTLIHYRARFENLDDFSLSDFATGSLKTAPGDARDITFGFSGDTAGQGWGVDESRGGMPIYSAMANAGMDFFIHCGDTIYADIPIPPTMTQADGGTWRNLVTPAKSKPAQTLEEYRGNYAYNLLAASVRRFNSCVPMLVQWDDHEVRNNWYPGQMLTEAGYETKDVNTLAERGRQAFLEYMPIRPAPRDPQRIYRAYSYGPLLDLLMLDERSYRGRNSPNRQTSLDSAASFLGPPQLEWLKQRLIESKAVWKVIASDMPLSVIARDGRTDYEAWANGDTGAPLGRELELANLLSFIKMNNIRNIIFLTADVHYAANLHYHPDRATFKDFDPFWEFISGPLHAGGFGPNPLDRTFGPEYRFVHAPAKPALGPGDDYAHFGRIHIDAKSKCLTLTQHNIRGETLVAQEIDAG